MSDAAGLRVTPAPIPGLLVVDLPVHADARGWFKENWQREKMVAAGLPDFGPVQHNVSFNESVGTTRGIHAEPWDKFVSVVTGRVFGAWVDLREGESFGRTFTIEIDPSRAVFVPRGVGNAYQTLEPATAYTYLVNDHWSPDAEYRLLNLRDETAAIDWPIDLDRSEVSEKDRTHPRLPGVSPVPSARPLILGADGQLGRALRAAMPDAVASTRAELDLADPHAVDAHDWGSHSVVINAAAYTAVDRAESLEGRRQAWAANVDAVARIARHCAVHRVPLVHVSSDYVFDGERSEYTEEDALCPLGVYGQTKAAGDALVAQLPRHYIVRTSWVIGAGSNFARTMAGLADRGVSPAVVDDQVGRLSFTQDIAAAIRHLVDNGAPFGTYNVTNSGPARSWADYAKVVFELRGRSSADVRAVSTAEYFADSPGAAPRPRHSILSLDKIARAGFEPPSADERLREFVASLD